MFKAVTFGALLEDEVGKMCTRLQRELDFRRTSQKTGQFGAAPDLCGGVRIVDAARMLVDLVRRSC